MNYPIHYLSVFLLLFFLSRKIPPSAILQVPSFHSHPFTFPFYPSFRSLRAANFSQSHPRFPLLQASVVASPNVLSLRGIYLCPSSEPTCFSNTQITVSRATLHCDARHPVATAFSCPAAVIFDRVEQHASVLGTRQMLLGFFVPPPPLLFHPAIVFRERFAHLRFSRAWLSGMHSVSRSTADRRLS